MLQPHRSALDVEMRKQREHFYEIPEWLSGTTQKEWMS